METILNFKIYQAVLTKVFFWLVKIPILRYWREKEFRLHTVFYLLHVTRTFSPTFCLCLILWCTNIYILYILYGIACQLPPRHSPNIYQNNRTGIKKIHHKPIFHLLVYILSFWQSFMELLRMVYNCACLGPSKN